MFPTQPRSTLFECTALKGTNKTGTLKPDANGYYTVVLGGLDMFNSRGQFYDLKGSENLFKESSAFMRRIGQGSLFGEWGHPRPYGISQREFVARVMDVDEKNISHHIRKVWLDPNYTRDKDGRQMVTILGEIKPVGAKADELRKMFETPGMNICFSIRSFTEDRPQRGVIHKTLREIVTWDVVLEPGLHVANKWNTPGLESLDATPFTLNDLQYASDYITSVGGVAMESANHRIQDFIRAYRHTEAIPASARW